MAFTAFDVQKSADDTVDAGINLVVDSVASLSGSVGVTKIMLGAAGTDGGAVTAANPVPVEISDVSGTLNSDITAIKTAVEGTLTVGSHAVTNAGTFAVQVDGAALTALQLIDDAVYVDDGDWTALASKHFLIGGVYSQAGRTITDGDTAPLAVDASGHLITSPHSVGTSLADGADNQINSWVDQNDVLVRQAVYGFAYNGTTWDRVRGDATNGLLVNLGTNNDVTLATLPDTSAGDLAAINTATAAIQTAVEGTLTVTGGGGGTEYTEDAAAAANPVGNAIILVREDARAGSLTTTDGDNVALRGNNKGEAYVIDTDAVALLTTIDADTSTIAGDTTSIDGKITACNTGAVVLSSGTVTTVSTVTNLAQLGGVAVTMGTGVRDAGTQRVTIATDDVVPAAQSGTWNITNVSGTVSLPTGAATAANQATHTTALELIDNMIVAHDAAITGATGLAAIGLNSRSTEPTAVGDGDAVRALATTLGKQVTSPYAIPGSTWTYAAASGGITNTTGVTAKAAGAAGVRNYVTRCQVINGHATVSTDVQIRDGAAGTVLWRGFAQAAGGGVTCVFDPPLRGTAATLVEVACGTTGTATYFNLQGFQALE